MGVGQGRRGPSARRSCACEMCAACKARAKRAARTDVPVPERCDLCGGPPAGRWKTFHYDHQHGTTKFRGWLCNMCNQALGLAGDNPALLQRMAEYLVERGFTVTRSVLR